MATRGCIKLYAFFHRCLFVLIPYFIDIGRARVGIKVLDGHQRILDLMRICYKVDWPDRELFIACYCSHWNKKFFPLRRWAVGYYDVKQGGKKSLKARLSKKH